MSVKNLKLPEVSRELQQHCDNVKRHIATEIKQQGPITFSRYMELALYAPGLGYYVVGTQKFGRHGDFVTAPEISSLFSQCLARQCAGILSENVSDILEFGAGSGVMAADILLELQRLNKLPGNYFIIELSPELKNRQQETIKNKAPELFEKVIWLSELPKKINAIILANEVLDAMPVNIFSLRDNKVFDRCIDWQDNQFVWFEKETSSDLRSAVNTLSIKANEYVSEINLALPAWINSLGDCLNQGAVFLIDYGFPQQEYYHPQRNQGTLMCHFQHHAHSNPLILPGIQDITAHVDFTALENAATNAGFTIAGFSNQANFLINSGLLNLIPKDVNMETQLKFANQIKLLTMPSEMGELFKVMTLTKGISWQ